MVTVRGAHRHHGRRPGGLLTWSSSPGPCSATTRGRSSSVGGFTQALGGR